MGGERFNQPTPRKSLTFLPLNKLRDSIILFPMDELKRMRAEPERQDETFSLGQQEMWTLIVPFFPFPG